MFNVNPAGNGLSLVKNPTGKSVENLTEPIRNGRYASPLKKDSVSFERQVRGTDDVKKMFNKILTEIRKQNPDLRIVTEGGTADGDMDILSRALKNMGDGYVLVLSDEFMAGLYAGDESYDRKTKALLECVKKLSQMKYPAGVWLEEDRAVFWQLKEQKPEGLPTMEQHKQEQNSKLYASLPSPSERLAQKLCLSTSSPYNTAAAYSRMAQAKTKTMVQTVMQETRRNISALKFMSAFGTEKEQARARIALRSLQKLLLRGNTKLKSFSEEALTEKRRKRAEEREQKEKEIQAALELKRRKTSRAIRDGAIRKEGQLDSLNIPGYYLNRVGRHRHKEYEDYIPAPAPVPSTPAIMPTGSYVPAAGPSADFAVTEIVTF